METAYLGMLVLHRYSNASWEARKQGVARVAACPKQNELSRGTTKTSQRCELANSIDQFVIADAVLRRQAPKELQASFG